MRVAVTGSTGLIGEALVDSLEADGHRVHRVVRSRDRAGGGDLYWSVRRGEIDATDFAGLDGVVHLAGEPFEPGRWTDEKKQRILASRAEGTRLLAGALASLDDPPPVLVSASAVGAYGNQGSRILTEDDPVPADSFLSRVCDAWERAARPAAEAGIRVVHPRTGVIIASRGPLIEKVRWPFRLGIGGRVGSGDQYHAWISLVDEVRALRFLLDGDLAGPVNLTAPTPVTNAELTEAIGRVMNRPTVMPVPLLALRVLYGEMGVTLATESQRAVPRRLLEAGFEWVHTDVREALREAL